MEEQEEKLPSGPPATSNTTIRNVWEESERKFVEQKAKKDRAVGKWHSPYHGPVEFECHPSPD